MCKALQNTIAIAKKQICINQRLKVYKIVWVAKEAELVGGGHF